MIPRNKKLIATLVCEPGCCAQIIMNKNVMVSRSLYANGKEFIAGQRWRYWRQIQVFMRQ